MAQLRVKDMRKVSQMLQVPDNWVAEGVTSDTRQIRDGQLFVALRGPHHDGHDFVSEALSTRTPILSYIVLTRPSYNAWRTILLLNQYLLMGDPHKKI